MAADWVAERALKKVSRQAVLRAASMVVMWDEKLEQKLSESMWEKM